nr:uncharacterized protein LOC117995721 [Maniola hyperantus]
MSIENAGPSKIPIPVDPSIRKRNQVKKNEHQPRQPLEESRKFVTPGLKPDSREPGISRAANDDEADEKHRRSVFADHFDSKSQPDDLRPSKIPIPVDPSTRKRNQVKKNEHQPRQPLEESRKFVTPGLKPDSREPGISRAANDDEADKKHRRSVFADHCDSKSQPDDLGFNSYDSTYNQDYGPELFDYLMMREETQLVPNICSLKRTAIMNFLVKINGRSGNPAAVQTAAWYFDTLLAVAEVEVKTWQVVAVACYWIALKIHGNLCSTKKLVIIGGNAYSANILKSAERYILKRLWHRISYPYLSWVCDIDNFVEIETAATFTYMAGLMLYKSLNLYRPSALAVAAICTALYVLDKTELLAKLAKNTVYKAAIEKKAEFENICTMQTNALCNITFPSYQYRALLENMKDHTLTEKILVSLKDHALPEKILASLHKPT